MLRARALISRRSRLFERAGVVFGTVLPAVFFLETGLFLLVCFCELACFCDVGLFSGFPARREPLSIAARIYSLAQQKSSAGLSFRSRRGYI